MMGIIFSGPKGKELDRLNHFERVRNWQPRCTCMQYCGGYRKTLQKIIYAQGMTRGYYFGNSSKHPGYKLKSRFLPYYSYLIMRTCTERLRAAVLPRTWLG